MIPNRVDIAGAYNEVLDNAIREEQPNIFIIPNNPEESKAAFGVMQQKCLIELGIPTQVISPEELQPRVSGKKTEILEQRLRTYLISVKSKLKIENLLISMLDDV